MKTYSQFISEAKEPKPDYLETVTRNMKRNKGVNVQASHTPKGAIRVHGMHVEPEQQGKGLGSWAMRNLKNLKNELRLSQSAEPGREGDLHRFYKRHKFKKVSPDSDTYHWKPQQ
jgi:GNAT superfamily N-acetyltransferase